MKHVELDQFLHAFTSRGFDSVSWAFLLVFKTNAVEYRRSVKWCRFIWDICI